jgi:uncharacterized membrane protein
MEWTHSAPAVLSTFLASFVEFVEAFTVVFAVGVTRGWRSAITGAFSGAALLTVLVLAFGPMLQVIPIRALQLPVGILLLLFGINWLKKAILRAAGVVRLHDETKIFAHQTEALRQPKISRNSAIDGVGFMASFQAVLIEGAEVVLIVITVGATENMLQLAGLGALAASLLVVLLGLVLHQPLARVPENTLKLVVGVFLSSFGVFWIGEGMRFPWMSHEWALIALIVAFLAAALCAVRVVKSQVRVQQG